MAVDALRTGAAGLMVMMRRNIELRRHVALSAQPVALGPQGCAMRLVTVGTGYPGAIHAALHERAVPEHLAIYLAVSMITAGIEKG